MGDIVLKNNSMLNSFMNFYKEISRSENDSIRCNFLFNFPSMIEYVDPKVYWNFKHVFLLLASDDSPKIRLYWLMICLDVAELVDDVEVDEVIGNSVEDFIIDERDPHIVC